MLGRRGRKERKRLMALLLAGAMVLSGMGISPISVQAEETEPVVEQVSETVSDGNAETTREVLGEEKGIAAASTTQDANAAMAAVQSGTEKDLYELDLSKGLTAGTTYDGGISVLGDMKYNNGAIQGSSNPSPSNGSIPKTGAALKLQAIKDGYLKVTVSLATKTYYFLEETENGPKQILKLDNKESGKKDLVLPVEAGKTYYLYVSGSKIKITSITVDYRTALDWSEIKDPVLGTPSAKGDTISVPYTAQVGGLGAEALEVTMYDADGKTVEKQSITAEGESGEAEFKPTASGTYSFKAELIRSEESSKISNTTTAIEFVLPMATPKGLNAENKGHGNVKLTWQAVAEAESYKVSVDGTVVEEGVTALAQTIKGLTVGQEYTFQVAAVRGENVSTPAEVKLTITEDAVKTWNFAAFGQGVDNKTANNGYSGSLDTGDLKIWEKNSKGKLVAASTDGLAFYYTTIDPATENFTLSADITVDEWTYTNGQEGFGLMAADRVGENGDSGIFWNNSYMLSATKVEYLWDATEGKVSDAGDKYTMKLGIGSQEKIGVTPENMNDSPTDQGFRSTMTTLETSAANSGNGAGTYNIVGKYTNSAEAVKDITDLNVQTTFHMILQRNNTGYFLSYTNVETGETVTNKYYHGKDGDELTRLDAENIYVGFFASRTATISVANAVLTTIDPAKDAPAESRPVTYVTPNYTIDSASVANSADYELVYYGNADGTLKITNSDNETVLSDAGVKANTKVYTHTTLKSGSNVFHVEFTPNADYRPSEYSLLSSYDTVTFDFTVNYNVKGRTVIYAAPEGRSTGSGTNSDPVDIYTAVKSVAPGQMIVLKGGTYALDKTVTIDRGVSGTTDARIYMIADPDSTSRPVLNFQRKCAGMILAGDYWYFQGFDVTGSADAQKGIQVSGNHNILDRIKAYKNGNTGIQISRYLGTDQFNQWPAHNTILNCSSYLNADKGYEDADGFAAKLTVGQGNVFDGCIAAYNADDGWDLFAKVQSGSIGVVTIQNCVAFKNGYILDENGREINAGNGNGFKMGGDSMPGAHVLKNSVAFANKAKGIDSNSCPDIKVYSSTTFDNESYNVAFYTNTAVNTAFAADGILSYKVSNKVAEQFKLLGTQNAADVKGATNYYFDGSKSVNNNGKEATASWFKSLDTASALKDGGITRNADGTINMNGFLELTDEVPEGVGARMSGRISGDITVIPDEPKQDDSKPENNNNNSNDNGSDSAGTSSAPETVNWNEVSSSVQDKVTEIAQNPAIATVNMNVVCTGEVQVPQKVLNTIKGTNVTVAFHSGNGVAMSISGQDLKNKDLSKIQNIDLTVDQTSNNIPANVVAAKTSVPTRQLVIKDTGSFGVNVNIHVNVGKENAGKTANLYRYNAEKCRLEYCGSFTVTSNGQSMFALKRGGNYLVTVTERRPSESVWFAEGDYTIKPGDTLSKIAQRNHMTLAELLRRNAQITNRNVIKVGQRLNLN